MKIYKLTITNEYAFLVEDITGPYSENPNIIRNVVPSDISIKLTIADDEGLPIGDYAHVYVPVFSKRALDCLFELMSGNVLIIEWSLGDIPMYATQIVGRKDYIDWTNSVYRKITSHLIVFSKYVFCENAIKNKHIFMIEGDPNIYVSQEFVDVVRNNQLTNFGFELIYESGLR